MVSRFSCDAVMSRNTSSSPPSCSYRIASSTGSPASRIFTKLVPFTTRPLSTSRQGMTRLSSTPVRLGLPPPRAHHQRREAHGVTVVPESVEVLHVAVFEQPGSDHPGRELVDQQLPLRHAELAIRLDLDRDGVGAHVLEPCALKHPRQPPAQLRVIAVRGEEGPQRAHHLLVQLA